jgi:hypothetical protein
MAFIHGLFTPSPAMLQIGSVRAPARADVLA